MRFRSALTFLTAISLAAACGGDDDGASSDASPGRDDGGGSSDADGAPPTDARPADLTCVNDPLPTTADNPLTVGGMVFTIEAGSQAELEDVLVEAHLLGADPSAEPLVDDTTGTDGLYDLTADSGGEPLDAFLYAQKLVNPPGNQDPDSAYFPSRLYPPAPVATSQSDVPIPVIPKSILPLLLQLAGNVEQDPDKGIILAIVVDCAGEPAAGATVTTSPEAGNTVYANEMGFPTQNRTTTSDQGLAFLMNVPEDEVVINAQVGGQDLRSHVVTVVAGGEPDAWDGEIIATAITPVGAGDQ
jgi:hypothetical protein